MILAKQFKYGNDAITLFIKQWMALIETPEFLALDENFPGMHATLSRLKEQAKLTVCTARQHRKPALAQLERLGLLDFFDLILVTERLHTKESLIRHQLLGLSECDWLLGDTGEDIKAGKIMSIKTCAVLSGFLNRSNLVKYCPDLILDSVTDFII